MLIRLAMLVAGALASSGTALAQQAPRTSAAPRVIVRGVGRARVSISKGRLRTTIDLSEEIVGCSSVTGAARSRLRQRGCASAPATFKLLDATVQQGKTYLLVLSEASDNCNVCGRCGATEALTLIWLELDANFRLRNKRSVAVEDCVAFIGVVRSGDAASETDEDQKFAFKNDTLVVEFEKRIFADSGDTISYRFSHLNYDRREPAKGFMITIETRDKSSSR